MNELEKMKIDNVTYKGILLLEETDINKFSATCIIYFTAVLKASVGEEQQAKSKNHSKKIYISKLSYLTDFTVSQI